MRSKKRLSNTAPVAMRMALAAGFLSAVADRFGLWGPIGTPGVSWGGFAKFLDYTATILPYLSTTLVAVAGWASTVAETLLGVALLAGVRVRLAALASGVLLLTFAIAMTVALGPEAPLSSLLAGPGPAGRVPGAAGCSVNQTTQPGQRQRWKLFLDGSLVMAISSPRATRSSRREKWGFASKEPAVSMRPRGLAGGLSRYADECWVVAAAVTGRTGTSGQRMPRRRRVRWVPDDRLGGRIAGRGVQAALHSSRR